MSAPTEQGLSYKAYLRAVGRQPIPAYDKLRTPRAPGDVEMPPVTEIWWREHDGRPPLLARRIEGRRG